jgi:hypothetical protein
MVLSLVPVSERFPRRTLIGIPMATEEKTTLFIGTVVQ